MHYIFPCLTGGQPECRPFLFSHFESSEDRKGYTVNELTLVNNADKPVMVKRMYQDKCTWAM